MKAHYLAPLLALALPLAAQTEAPPKSDAPTNTEKLWHIKTSGIGG